MLKQTLELEMNFERSLTAEGQVRAMNTEILARRNAKPTAASFNQGGKGKRVRCNTFRLRFVLMLLSLISIAVPAQAQGDSCETGLKVGFRASVCSSQNFTVTLNGTSVSGNGTTCSNRNWVTTDLAYAELKLEETSQLTVGTNSCSTHVNFEVPEGYVLEVDGKETTTIDKGGSTKGSGDGTWSVVLRKKCPCNESDDSGPGGSGGPELGSVLWSVGLGNLPDGRSARSISLREATLSANAYTPAALIYSPPGNSDAVDVVRAVDGSLRQVKAPQALADIVVIGGSEYDIRFYRPADVGAKANGLYPVTGQPFITWKIKNPNPPSVDHLQISKIQNGITDTSEYSWDAFSNSWSLSKGGGARVEMKTVSYPTETSRTDTFVVKNGGGQVASKSARTYHTFAWGEELVQEIADPDTAALTTTYKYYENAAEPNRYRRIESVTYPDGSWEKYDYDASRNKVLVMRPWKDLSLASATEANSRATRYTYSNYDGIDVSLYPRLVSSVEEKITGIAVRKTTYSRTGAIINGNPSVVESETVYSSSTEGLTTVTTKYHSSASAFLANRVSSIEYPDGRKDTYSYEKGFYTSNPDPALNQFSPDANGTAERSTVVHGTIASPNGIPHKTTKDVAVLDQYGNQVLQEVYVYKGTDYERVSWTASEYDDQGHLSRTINSKGQVSSGIWSGDRKSSEINESGVETVYTYDSLGRIATSTKKGIPAAGGFPAQPDIVMTPTYDAEGHLTGETVSGGGPTLSKFTSYDLAGRLKTVKDQAELITTYTYANGGRTQTVTQPGGATEISDRYLDGQTKSVTGTAVVANAFNYGVNADGTQYSQNYAGSAGLNSPRWTKTTTDWMGRTVRVEKPSFTGANLVQTSTYNAAGQLQKETATANAIKLISDKLFEYDQLGRQSRAGSDINADSALTLSSTDRLSETELVYEKVGNDWFLVISSKIYLVDNNTTPVLQTQRIRLNNFVANGTDQTVSEITMTDVAGNATKVTTSVDRAAKKQTVVTDTPQSNLNAVDVSINGLLQSSNPTTPQSATTYGYDSLGRQISVTDPRTGATTRSYSATTGQLTATNDGAGTTLFEYYPATHVNAGQLKAQINAAGKKVYFNYGSRGDLIQTWGEATYPIEYVYDPYGQKTEMHTFRGGQGWTASTWPAAATGTADVTKWIYQESTGLLSQKQDAALKGATYTHDELGRLKTRVWARPITCTYTYDANTGELRTVTYSDSTPALAFTYDRGGRQVGVTDASGSHTQSFNVAGELQTDQIAGGILDGVGVNVGYDGFMRRQSLQTSHAANTLNNQTYGYDSTSRLETIISGSQTATYAYYPNSGLLNTTSFTGGTNIARSYDPQGRLQNITTTPAADIPQSYTYAYNDLNQRWRVTREDGTYWNYIYNDRGELVSGKKYWSDNSIVWGAQTEYNFDNIGNRKDAKNGGNQLGTLRQSAYTANSLNQYSQRSVPGAVDISGTANTAAMVTVNSQATGRRADYFHKELAVDNSAAPVNAQINVVGARNNFGAGGEDAVTEKGGRVLVPRAVETYTYDDDGNLTSDGRWNYSWNGENRLVSMEAIASVPAEAKQRLEFAYDYMARRIQKKVYVWNVPTASYQLQSVTKFVYDGWNLMAELDVSNALIRSYVWGQDKSGTLHGAGGIGGLLTIEGEGNTYCVGHDGEGNVTTLVNSGVGTISALYDYDSFGNTLRASGDYASKNPFRFSTKHADQETGLIYYGYRYFNPSNGRWLTRDPVEESGGANLYVLLANDSINRSDYLGLLDPLEFWRKWSATQRKKWFDDFRKSYNTPINDAANKHCVPKQLLAAIIANEMIDYSSSEAAGEWAGFGQSLGPAQITINTAIRYGLTDLHQSQFGPSWIPWRSAEKNYKSAVRKYLQDPAKNIDAAARLMAKYLDELCNRALNGGLNKGFIRDIVAGGYLQSFCCRKKSCNEVVNMNPPDALIRAMAALWNNDVRVTEVGDPARESPNAYNHAWWASRLFNAPVVD